MTIKDIARECGCAVGTVSRVLNNQSYVSEKTRRRVMDVVNKYGFALNKNAKLLKEQTSKSIAVIVNGTSSIFLNDILEKIQKRFEKLPYVLSVIILGEDENVTQKACQIYYEQKPLGIIFLGGNPERSKAEFENIKIPCVLISARSEAPENQFLSSVSTDDKEASKAATEFLIQNGHTQIGVIGGDINHSETSSRRFKGFMEAMNDAGISFDYEKSYSKAQYLLEDGAKAAEELITKNPHITAIFAMADVLAIGACRTLTNMGFTVPDKISLFGFDGIQIGQYYCPKLATIKQITEDLAQNGMDALLDQIQNKAQPSHKLIPFELIPGESVRKI